MVKTVFTKTFLFDTCTCIDLTQDDKNKQIQIDTTFKAFWIMEFGWSQLSEHNVKPS